MAIPSYRKMQVIRMWKKGRDSAYIAAKCGVIEQEITDYITEYNSRPPKAPKASQATSVMVAPWKYAKMAFLKGRGQSARHIASTLEVPQDVVAVYLRKQAYKNKMKALGKTVTSRTRNSKKENAHVHVAPFITPKLERERESVDTPFKLSVAKTFGYISAICDITARELNVSEAEFKSAVANLLQADFARL